MRAAHGVRESSCLLTPLPRWPDSESDARHSASQERWEGRFKLQQRRRPPGCGRLEAELEGPRAARRRRCASVRALLLSEQGPSLGCWHGSERRAGSVSVGGRRPRAAGAASWNQRRRPRSTRGAVRPDARDAPDRSRHPQVRWAEIDRIRTGEPVRAVGETTTPKKKGLPREREALEKPRRYLLSRVRNIIGSSCLTTVFGMGTGMARSL